MIDTCVELRSEDEQSMEKEVYMGVRIQHNICGHPFGCALWEVGDCVKRLVF